MARQALEEDARARRREFESTGKSKKARLEPRMNDLLKEVLDEAGACTIRLTHYAAGPLYAIWALLYSDDGWLIGRGEHYEIGLLLASSC